MTGWENKGQHSSGMDVKFLAFVPKSLHVSFTRVSMFSMSSCSVKVNLASCD